MKNRKISERIIKIIDWISRIMAVALAVGSSFFAICFIEAVAAMDQSEYRKEIYIYSVIVCLSLQLGLFFAPNARQRGIICRVMVAILMLPSNLILLAIGIKCWFSIGTIFCGRMSISNINYINYINMSIMYIIITIIITIINIVYATQYYLLFKGKKTKENIHNEYSEMYKEETLIV